MLSLNAYQNDTPRENVFNQTDFVYKTMTGPVLHTVAFGTEFGRQTGLSLRNSGVFPNNANKPSTSSIRSIRPISGRSSSPIIATDANSKYQLNIAVGLCAGPDRGDALAAIPRRRALRQFRYVGARPEHQHLRNRVDDKISPRAAVIVKPIDNMSIYTA